MGRYSKYQNTDNWFGTIPATWETHRIKRLFALRDKRNFLPLEQVNLISLYSNVGVRQHCDIEHTTGNRARNADGYKVVHKDDIIVNILLCWMGAIGRSNYDGVTSPAYDVYMPRTNINSQYYHYLFRTKAFSGECYKVGKGIMAMRWRTYSPQFMNINVPVPPRAEQDQIVRFLDWKVSEINKLIGIRRKEIQELEEFKRSRIADIIMGQTAEKKKKSHINWMPFIPENWDEKPLIRYAFEQCKKNTGMVENNLLSLSYGKIVNKDINTTDGLLPANFEGYQIVDEGNIILRLTDLQNDHNSLRTGLVTQKGIITSAYLCLNTRDGILPEYLQLELHVADLCKAFYGMGGGVRQSIGFKDIKRMYIAIPSLKEQKIILSQIHNLDIPIDDQINTYHKIILELEALKNTIISDVVTGKIDVRNIPVPAYEHVDDLTADDGEDNDEETGIPGEED